MDRSLSKGHSTVDGSGTDIVLSFNISSPDGIEEQHLVTSSNPIKDYVIPYLFLLLASNKSLMWPIWGNWFSFGEIGFWHSVASPFLWLWGRMKAFATEAKRRLPEKSSEILFVISCITVSLDLFIFYVPTIDENHKCLDMDYKLMIVVLMLRSLSDLAFICCRIVTQIQQKHDHKSVESDQEKRRLRLLYEWIKSDCVLDLLLILPVHQVTIVMAFFRLGSYGHSYKTAAVNTCLVLQLILRAFRIYNFCKKSKFSRRKACALNFFLYILAAHVLGAFWYLFSIRREISCWHRLCEDTAGCKTTYNCHSDTSTSPSVTRLDESCPVSSENTAKLGLGIYFDAFQSGTTNGTLNFPTKYLYTFWWGLRNLSNFGTNLETSSYGWENLFAVLISVIGMLLFSCLIGNVQKYMQLESKHVGQKNKIMMKENELKEAKSSAMEEKIDQLLQLQVSQGKRLEEMEAKLGDESGATCNSCNLCKIKYGTSNSQLQTVN